jgi:elongation factor Ts
MAVAIELIKQLREETGAGILECRRVLEETHQNYAQALGNLRERGLQKAAKRSERPAVQGVIELYSHGNGRLGVMLEVNTETDFAGRSAAVHEFAHELALQIAAAAPEFVREEDIPAERLEQEAQKAAEQARMEGKNENIVPRIVEGQLKKFKDRKVLLRQASIRDETVTVAQLLGQTIAAVGENVVIRRFVRWELGEETDPPLAPPDAGGE